MHLVAVLTKEGFNVRSDVILVLDNAAVNRSQMTRSALEELGLQTLYLPAYTPQLAPVEAIFGIVKGRMSGIKVPRPVRFGSPEGEELLKGELDRVESKSILQSFTLSIRWARQYLRL